MVLINGLCDSLVQGKPFVIDFGAPVSTPATPLCFGFRVCQKLVITAPAGEISERAAE